MCQNRALCWFYLRSILLQITKIRIFFWFWKKMKLLPCALSNCAIWIRFQLYLASFSYTLVDLDHLIWMKTWDEKYKKEQTLDAYLLDSYWIVTVNSFMFLVTTNKKLYSGLFNECPGKSKTMHLTLRCLVFAASKC